MSNVVEKIQTKQCNKCGLTKEVSEFSKQALNKDGLHGSCRECLSAYKKELRLKNPKEAKLLTPRQIRVAHNSNPDKVTKICCECNLELPLTYFNKVSANKDGLNHRCRECTNIYKVAWKEANPGYKERDHASYLTRKAEDPEGYLERSRISQAKLRKQFPERYKQYGATQRARHPERIKARKSKYYFENQERLTLKSREYYKENQEYLLLYSRIYYDEHKLEYQEYRRNYYQENTEQCVATIRRWGKENPDKLAGYQRRRRAIKANLDGFHTLEDIDNLYIEQLGKCIYCPTSLKDYFEIDHIVPISREGSSDYAYNLQLLCKSCNCSKNNKTHEEYVEFMDKKDKLETIELLKHWRL